MPIIASISGIRGTLGGKADDCLTPVAISRYTAAFAQLCRNKFPDQRNSIVVGRDGRASGAAISQLVISTLQMMGVDVIDLGMATTPTVEMAVTAEQAVGGIILSASHNPAHWNALKLLNEKGEFISAADGETLLQLVETEAIQYAEVTHFGKVTAKNHYLDHHIERIVATDLVNQTAIRARRLKVVVDGINSIGAIAVPALLRRLGVRADDIIVLNATPNGIFAHNPEPLAEHLHEIAAAVVTAKADLGIVVDPDVDRLAFICEDGSMFGEEYTLVAVADYVLRYFPSATVSNLSSTRALRDITEQYQCDYYAAAVGEVNVVLRMKEVGAVIGGEGNGGIIYAPLHYGRDALVGIALFLSHFAQQHYSMTQLKDTYPAYYMCKDKIELLPTTDVAAILEQVQTTYSDHIDSTIDGVKLAFDKDWIHLRRSNTEPIIRIYAESSSAEKAAERVAAIKAIIAQMAGEKPI